MKIESYKFDLSLNPPKPGSELTRIKSLKFTKNNVLVSIWLLSNATVLKQVNELAILLMKLEHKIYNLSATIKIPLICLLIILIGITATQFNFRKS